MLSIFHKQTGPNINVKTNQEKTWEFRDYTKATIWSVTVIALGDLLFRGTKDVKSALSWLQSSVHFFASSDGNNSNALQVFQRPIANEDGVNVKNGFSGEEKFTDVKASLRKISFAGKTAGSGSSLLTPVTEVYAIPSGHDAQLLFLPISRYMALLSISPSGIVAKVFDGAGNAVVGQTVLRSSIIGFKAAVAQNEDSFRVVWSGDGSQSRLIASQLFRFNGTHINPSGGMINGNRYGGSNSVALDASGKMLESFINGACGKIYFQWYNNGGYPLGNASDIGATACQSDARFLSDGSIVGAWPSSFYQTFDQTGVPTILSPITIFGFPDEMDYVYPIPMSNEWFSVIAAGNGDRRGHAQMFVGPTVASSVFDLGPADWPFFTVVGAASNDYVTTARVVAKNFTIGTYGVNYTVFNAGGVIEMGAVSTTASGVQKNPSVAALDNIIGIAYESDVIPAGVYLKIFHLNTGASSSSSLQPSSSSSQLLESSLSHSESSSQLPENSSQLPGNSSESFGSHPNSSASDSQMPGSSVHSFTLSSGNGSGQNILVIAISAGVGGGTLFIVIVGGAVVFVFRMMRRKTQDNELEAQKAHYITQENSVELQEVVADDSQTDKSLPEIPESELLFEKKPLGEGSYGTVYKGYWGVGEIPVAVKKTKYSDPSSLEEFKKEAKTIIDANFPYIIGCHGIVCFQDGTIGIVLPFMNRGSFDNYLHPKSGNITESPAFFMRILFHVSQALVFLHAKGIIHRDVKPQNILITENGDGLLSDFGTARKDTGDDTKTSGVGTPVYLAPEVIEGNRHYHTTADIYSFGVVGYEAYTGKRPYSDDTQFPSQWKICDFVIAGKRLEISDPWHEIFLNIVGLVELISKCWAADPQNRPPAKDVVIALKGMQLSEESVRLFKSKPPQRMSKALPATPSTTGMYGTQARDSRKLPETPHKEDSTPHASQRELPPTPVNNKP